MTRKARNLQVFQVVGGDICGGLKIGDKFTIDGYFEPTWWERMRRKPFFTWCWVVRWRVTDYCSNLWAAICGRHDDY